MRVYYNGAGIERDWSARICYKKTEVSGKCSRCCSFCDARRLGSLSGISTFNIGVVFAMWTEKANAGVKYSRIADQTDFNKL